jgi:hypothetical protein
VKVGHRFKRRTYEGRQTIELAVIEQFTLVKTKDHRIVKMTRMIGFIKQSFFPPSDLIKCPPLGLTFYKQK